MTLLINELGPIATACAVGILVMRDVAPGEVSALDEARRAAEQEIRARFAGLTRPELRALHPLDAYVAYYKQFGATYHVQLQLESILKGKGIPGGLPLVQAMFMAELSTQLLTAGHDLARVELPLRLRVASGEERYTTLSGRETTCVPGDLLLADGEGVISSILKGPDQRTAITAETTAALYTVYAPEGVEDELVLAHLSAIEGYVRLAAPGAVTAGKEVVKARAAR